MPGATLAICSQAAIDQFNESVAGSAQQPTDQPWGNRAMLFRDPDGNIVNFFTTTQPNSPMRPQH